jgi:hypothetical protein
LRRRRAAARPPAQRRRRARAADEERPAGVLRRRRRSRAVLRPDVEVDGLLVGEPEATAGAVLHGPAHPPRGRHRVPAANRFTSAWAEANPEAAAAGGEWFRNDPGVRARIEAEGHLGLGLETDAAFIEEWF